MSMSPAEWSAAVERVLDSLQAPPLLRDEARRIYTWEHYGLPHVRESMGHIGIARMRADLERFVARVPAPAPTPAQKSTRRALVLFLVGALVGYVVARLLS